MIENFIESIQKALIVVDAAGIIRFSNSAARQLPGINISEGVNFFSYFHFSSGLTSEKLSAFLQEKKFVEDTISLHTNSRLKFEATFSYCNIGSKSELIICELNRFNPSRAIDNLRDYQQIIKTLNEAVYIQDENGVFIDLNETALNAYGYDLKEVIGKTPEFLSAPGMNNLFQLDNHFSDALEGKPVRFIFWGKRANGEIFPKEVSLSSGIYMGNKVIIALARDISERIKSQLQRDKAIKELTENQRLLNAIVKYAKDSIFVKDRNGRYQFVNEARANIFGLKTSEFIGKTDVELFGEKTAASIGEIDKRILAGEILERFPVKEIDGQKRYFHSIKVPIKNENDEIVGLCGISREITETRFLMDERDAVINELKASETKYKNVSKLLRLMCDNVPDMIWAKDMNKQFIFTNKAICEKLLMAKDTDEPTGKTDLYFAQRERESNPDPHWHTFGEICRNSDAIVMKNRQAERFDEYGNIRGKFLFLDVYKAPFWDEHGNMIGTVGCGRDVTDERKLQQEHRRIEKELKAKTLRMDALIKAIPDLLFVVNKDAVYIDYHANTEQQLLLPENQIIGSSLYDTFDKTEARRQHDIMLKCIETGENQLIEYDIEWQGKMRYFETRISKMDDDHVLAIVRNITDAVNLEKDLAWQSDLRQLLMDLATRFINIPVSRFDNEINDALGQIGSFIEADRVYIFDYDFEKQIQSNTYEWCAEGITSEINNLKAVPNYLIPEWVEAHKRGQNTFVEQTTDLPPENNLRKIIEPQGIKSLITIPLIHKNKCLGYIGFDAVKNERTWSETELTLLKLFAQLLTNFKIKTATEKALIESETKFRNLAELAPFGIMIYQGEKWVYANNAGSKISGYSQQELYQKKYWEFVAPEYREMIRNRGQQRQNKHEVPDEYEFRIITKSGKEKWVMLNGALIEYQGKPAGLISVADITERKMMEQELIAAKDRAVAADKLKSAFISNVSHEIRTPLNSIMGLVELLSTQELDENEKKSFSDFLQQSGERFIQTISDYMDSSLIVSGNQEILKSKVNPAELIKDVWEEYKPRAEKKHLQFLAAKNPTTDFTFISDPELIKKVLKQLISNAIKFTLSGEVKFGYRIKDAQIIFFVSDTGIGISEEAQPHIFGYFMQEDQSTIRRFEGSGLGLSIAKGLVDLLGGEIRFTTKKDSGSTFTFSIPFQNISPDRERKKQPQPTGSAKQPVILLVEDDYYNYKFMTTVLEKNNFAKVILAVNGKLAVEKCRELQEINLVLMDMKLPEMDGYEATREIRKIRPELPIIAVTAFATSGDEKKVLDAGCNDYITKPIKRQELFDKIRNFGFS
jgi:PAS domain S-box-containing protein